jgi:hypothetical protein
MEYMYSRCIFILFIVVSHFLFVVWKIPFASTAVDGIFYEIQFEVRSYHSVANFGDKKNSL